MNTNDKDFIVRKIRSEYTERSETELDALRALDKHVRRPAYVFAYSFGSLSALIMGSGMSFVMTDIAEKLGIGDMMIPGIVIGGIGLLMAVLTYPIYKRILASRKKHHREEVLALSEKVMGR